MLSLAEREDGETRTAAVPETGRAAAADIVVLAPAEPIVTATAALNASLFSTSGFAVVMLVGTDVRRRVMSEGVHSANN